MPDIMNYESMINDMQEPEVTWMRIEEIFEYVLEYKE